MTENESAKPAGAKMANDEAAYKNALLERFREAPPATPVAEDASVLSEKAVDYIYRAIDRQINKARGALAYNGLLFASFGLIARNSKGTVILTLACLGAILALASCFPLIHLMMFDVGDSTNYATSQSDFTATFASMWKRRLSLKVALWVSGIATVFAIFLPMYFLLGLLCGQIPQ